VLENRWARYRREQERERKEAQERAEQVRSLRSSRGWSDLVEPFLTEWREQAVRRLLREATLSGPEEQFLKGGAALVEELNLFLDAVIAEAEHVRQEDLEAG
jgi:hypothetical protein